MEWCFSLTIIAQIELRPLWIILDFLDRDAARRAPLPACVVVEVGAWHAITSCAHYVVLRIQSAMSPSSRSS